MKYFPSLLLAATPLLLFPAVAHAYGVESWRFDTSQNQLVFTTDRDVQPRAQLIADPTRLVIDLPGIVLGRPSFTEPVSNGAIRSVRIGQFDRFTTRLVVELAAGYTIDPDQVKFRGVTARQWIVQLPAPQAMPVAAEPTQPETGDTQPAPLRPIVSGNPNRSSGDTTRLENLRITSDGFFIRTSGGSPEIRTSRSSDRQQITFELPDTVLAPGLQRDLLVNRYGVYRIQATQTQTSPPAVRLTLNVNRTSPDWEATVSSLGGLVLLPAGGASAAAIDNRPPDTSAAPPTSDRLATIEAVDLNSNLLVIRADQSLRYSTGWDRSSGAYRITVNSARLASNVKGPQLTAASPVLKIRLRQENPRTVVILVQPASGVQVRGVSQPSQRILALQLQRGASPVTTPLPAEPIASIPVPQAPRSSLPPRASNPVQDLPRVPNGKLIVVVDPGHGGPDPGAIGVGGIQEKDIVLDIATKVAELLDQQGIQAILTRKDDIDLDLEPRVALAERIRANLFVSIHANSIDLSRPDISGLETYYYNSGEQLARTIHESVLEATGIPDRRVRSARFYVLRKTSMPSVLVEVGFVTGRDDAARLSDPNYRSQMAAGIVRGILQYIQRSIRS